MNPTFEKLYGQLGRGTFTAFAAALGFLVIALLAALLGLTHAVESFKTCAALMGSVSILLLCLFLGASLVMAVFRRLDHRRNAAHRGT